MVELARRMSLSELKGLRKQFGPGQAGKSAFRLIAKGAACEGNKIAGNECNSLAMVTVDFDVPRVNALEQIPSCIPCQGIIMTRIARDFARENSSPSFGVNGLGRT